MFVATQVVDSLQVGGFVDLVVFAAAIGLVNAFVRPILRLLSLPIRIATFGLATLVIDGILFVVTAAVTGRATTGGLLAAIAAALVISVISTAVTFLIPDGD